MGLKEEVINVVVDLDGREILEWALRKKLSMW